MIVPQVDSDSFDIVFSMNLLEHVESPWSAAKEMVRIVKPGGMLIQIVPFSWRYHPHPVDHWRFSHTGLQRLFVSTGQVETIESGYDITMRRKDHRGEFDDKSDAPPVDDLGGWREHWHSVWVGTKKHKHKHGEDNE